MQTASVVRNPNAKNAINWMMTWAFPIDEKKAVSEGYAKSQITGKFSPSSTYNGCPYCGSKTFVHCDQCGHLTCYQSSDKIVTCSWCGNSGETTAIDELTLESGAM